MTASSCIPHAANPKTSLTCLASNGSARAGPERVGGGAMTNVVGHLSKGEGGAHGRCVDQRKYGILGDMGQVGAGSSPPHPPHIATSFSPAFPLFHCSPLATPLSLLFAPIPAYVPLLQAMEAEKRAHINTDEEGDARMYRMHYSHLKYLWSRMAKERRLMTTRVSPSPANAQLLARGKQGEEEVEPLPTVCRAVGAGVSSDRAIYQSPFFPQDLCIWASYSTTILTRLMDASGRARGRGDLATKGSIF